MKRKTLEKIWVLFVISMIIIICAIGVFALFSEYPITKIKYIFITVLLATPINVLMMYFTCNAKE